MTAMKITAAVASLIPLAVDPEAPPIIIMPIQRKTVGEWTLPKSTVVSPAVRTEVL